MNTNTHINKLRRGIDYHSNWFPNQNMHVKKNTRFKGFDVGMFEIKNPIPFNNNIKEAFKIYLKYCSSDPTGKGLSNYNPYNSRITTISDE